MLMPWPGMQEALARHFGDGPVAQLKSADWKLRKEGMEAVVDAIVAWGSFSDGVRVGETIQGLAYLPGWAEKNFQVGGSHAWMNTRLGMHALLGCNAGTVRWQLYLQRAQPSLLICMDMSGRCFQHTTM